VAFCACLALNYAGFGNPTAESSWQHEQPPARSSLAGAENSQFSTTPPVFRALLPTPSAKFPKKKLFLYAEAKVFGLHFYKSRITVGLLC